MSQSLESELFGFFENLEYYVYIEYICVCIIAEPKVSNFGERGAHRRNSGGLVSWKKTKFLRV